MASRALAVWRNRQVIKLLVRRDLKVKYQQSFLGYAWSLLEPLAMAGIYYFVFGVLYQSRVAPGGEDAPGGYPLFLICGILPWLAFSSGLSEATKALITHGKLIKTMKVPREIFPISMVASKLVDYLFTLPVLFVFVIILGGRTDWSLLWLPLAVVTQFAMLLGVTLLLSSLNVMLRDVQRVIRILNRVIFYSTPIIYPISRVMDTERIPQWFKDIYELNPLVGIFQMHRAVWFPTETPSPAMLTATLVGTLIMLGVGYWTFRRLETSVLKEL